MCKVIDLAKERKRRKTMPKVLKGKSTNVQIPIFTVEEFLEEIGQDVADILVKVASFPSANKEDSK